MRQRAGGPEVLLLLALGFFDLRGRGVARGFSDEFPACWDTVKIVVSFEIGI